MIEPVESAPVLVPIKRNFELPGEGTHPATIVDVVHGGEGSSRYGQRRRTLLTITFRLDDQQDADGEPILLDQNLTFVIRPNSAFNKLLIRLGILVDYKSPTFDARSIVGKTLNVRVQHTTPIKNRLTFANVVDYPQTHVRVARQVATIVNEVEVA
jgi:hypothetical protein